MAGKPRIVYLDIDDEITSAASRIRSAEASRVALVVPPGSRVATSRINFRLLAREALESGRQLAIVAPDAASRSLAAAAGLDVFRTVGEYEAADAERSAAGSGRGRAVEPTTPGPAGAAAAGVAAAGVAAGAGEDGIGLGASSPGLAASATPATRRERAMPVTGGPVAPEAAGDLRPRSNVAGVRPVGAAAAGRSGRRILLAGLGLLVLGLAVVGGVAGYLLLPQATIVVVPKVEPIGPVQATITADPNAATTDVNAGVVPAQRISFPVQVGGTFKATGQKVDETKATGTVTFTSQNTLFDVTVPAGTDLSTHSGVHFLVTKDVTVPKASFATGPTSVDTTVTALKAGPSGNVPADTITSEPLTLSAALISVANAKATAGGSRTVTPKVLQADVDTAQGALRQQLQDGFAKALQAGTGVPSGMTLFPETAKLGDAKFSADPASFVGQLVAQFQLGASAAGIATAVDERPVKTVAEARLRAQARAGYDLVAGSVDVTVGEPTVSGDTVTFPATGSASEVRRLDPSTLEANVRGLPVEQARQVLAAYGGVTITTWPDWVSSIPTYDFRVDLTVRPSATVEPTPGASGGTSPGSSAAGSSAPASRAPASGSSASPSPS